MVIVTRTRAATTFASGIATLARYRHQLAPARAAQALPHFHGTCTTLPALAPHLHGTCTTLTLSELYSNHAQEAHLHHAQEPHLLRKCLPSLHILPTARFPLSRLHYARTARIPLTHLHGARTARWRSHIVSLKIPALWLRLTTATSSIN